MKGVQDVTKNFNWINDNDRFFAVFADRICGRSS
jgi:hypothetical protein